jgi:hypothetical protein
VELATTFGCATGVLPFTYLGLPLGTMKPTINDMSPLVRSCQKKRCIYKLLTKVLTILLEPFADKLISANQNSFIKKGNIIDGIMSLHEIFAPYSCEHVGIILKLGFKKVCDKVD